MGFDSYLSRLADSNEFAKNFLKNQRKSNKKNDFIFLMG